MNNFQYISSFLILFILTNALDWDDVDNRLLKGIDDRVYPGGVFYASTTEQFLHSYTFGNYFYNTSSPRMELSTLFDLASCTKVLSTTIATMQFYQRGELYLDELVCSKRLLGSAFANKGKDKITIHNLLVHNSGFPPDPTPNFWSKHFKCYETDHKPQPRERFDCSNRCLSHLLYDQDLWWPTGSHYRYSDISMITMMYVIGKLARDLKYITIDDIYPDCFKQDTTDNIYTSDGPLPIDQCFFEAYIRKYVHEPINMTYTRFNIPKYWWPMAAPTENDTGYLTSQIQGYVSDGNAYALGGIAGHAGLFSSANDIKILLKLLLQPDDKYLNISTIHTFTQIQNSTQSSRGLGWDTNLHHSLCGNLSSETFLHSGYTGTLVCIDPKRDLYVILLASRVYPNDHVGFGPINEVRKDVMSIISKIVPEK